MSFNIAMPKVSLLVPVYNSETYISRCLKSLLVQSHDNIEIICIDDGSSDGSPSILDDYSVRFPCKVRVFHQTNKGSAAARNLAIELATGDYLAFVDNDDWLDKDFVKTLLDVALKYNTDIVCSGYRRPDENGEITFETCPNSADEWGKYLVGAAWAKLFRTDYVREHKFVFLNTNIDEDLYFTLPAIELAQRVQVVSYCGYNWFINSASVSNTRQRHSDGLLFEETLNAIFDMLYKKQIKLTPILVHYFVRLVSWFLIYTSKEDGLARSRTNRDHYVKWLDRSVPNWRQEPYASPFHPTGDAIKNRLAVWLFARHPHLFSVFLDFYGKV